MTTFSDRIRLARQLKGWSGAELGEKLQPDDPVPRQTISHWETGLHYPGLLLFARLCSELGASADWLLFGVQSAPSTTPAKPPEHKTSRKPLHSPIKPTKKLSRREFERLIPPRERRTKTAKK